MSELYFRMGETEGFTSKKLADEVGRGYGVPIRELLQNSVDAADGKQCDVSLYVDSIPVKDIPHIDEYRNTLKKAVAYHKKIGSYNENAQQRVRKIEDALGEEKLDVLMCVDNGVGMGHETLNGLMSGQSIKSNKGSGGSFGVGHYTSYSLSSLNYVLYASRYKADDVIRNVYSGVPILAGYKDKDGTDRGSVGRILAKQPRNEGDSSTWRFPSKFPPFIQKKMKGIKETGSMVVIVGLNEPWDREEVNYAIVSNFFYALHKGNLVVRVTDKKSSYSITKNDIDTILARHKDRIRAGRGEVLSGQQIFQSWRTLKDGTCHKVTLSQGDKVSVYIRNGVETNSVVALARNGMLIARHDNMLSWDMNNLRNSDDFEPFSVVIHVDVKECPQLHRLVRLAEGPHHNDLQKGRLSRDDDKELKRLLKKLVEGMKTYLKENERSEVMDLPIGIGEGGKTTGETSIIRTGSQTERAKTIVTFPKTPTTIKPKNREAPTVDHRELESKNSLRIIKGDGDTLEVKIWIEPLTIDEGDNVYLSLRPRVDDDAHRLGQALSFDILSIDDKGKGIERSKDRRFFNVTEFLVKEKVCTVTARVEKPEGIHRTHVTLAPYLGLRQKKFDKNQSNVSSA